MATAPVSPPLGGDLDQGDGGPSPKRGALRLALFLGAFACTTIASAETTVPTISTETGTSTQQAYVTVQLDINERGSVDDCHIASTDAPQAFAEKICPIMAKAKMKPDVDENGNPKRSTKTQTIRFAIQN